MADKEVCIGGNKYRILDDNDYGSSGSGSGGNVVSPQPYQQTVDMSTSEAKLTRLIDINGGGNIGGGYRSIVVAIPPHEKSYEIGLGLNASQVNIRCDQGITLTLNGIQSDNIFIEVAEFPFSISDLKLNESIHTIYVSTGDNPTNIKVLAFGLVR